MTTATPPAIDQERYKGLRLSEGSHSDPGAGLCLMEAVAYVRGLPHTDSPPCVSLLLGQVGRGLNDSLNDAPRQRLTPLVLDLPGTAVNKVADPALERKRCTIGLDWVLREAVPILLDLFPDEAGLAAQLRDRTMSLRDCCNLLADRPFGFTWQKIVPPSILDGYLPLSAILSGLGDAVVEDVLDDVLDNGDDGADAVDLGDLEDKIRALVGLVGDGDAAAAASRHLVDGAIEAYARMVRVGSASTSPVSSPTTEAA